MPSCPTPGRTDDVSFQDMVGLKQASLESGLGNDSHNMPHGS